MSALEGPTHIIHPVVQYNQLKIWPSIGTFSSTEWGNIKQNQSLSFQLKT